MIPTAEDYVRVLKLDEDQVEEVQEEIDLASKSWEDAVGATSETCRIEGDDILEKLVLGLNVHYCKERHGGPLKALLKDGQLSKLSFVDWNVRNIFDLSEEERQFDADIADGDYEPDVTSSGGTAKDWSGIKWAIAPTAAAEEGVTYLCGPCRVLNDWKNVKCRACDTRAPHADELEKDGSGGGEKAPEKTPAPSSGFTPFATPSTTSSKITFGGAPSIGTVSFGAQPQASPAFTFGAGAPVSFGATPTTKVPTFGAAAPGTTTISFGAPASPSPAASSGGGADTKITSLTTPTTPEDRPNLTG